VAVLPLRSDEFAEFLIADAAIDMWGKKGVKWNFALIKGYESPVDIQLRVL
jgi:hypothetical protein